MTMERSSTTVVRKPWGKTDRRPWSELGHDGVAVGELWFQRADREAPEPDLLLKLLFTEEPLSIQVHPDDTFAKSIGLPHGKTEAWYVLSAAAEGQVALGLKRELTPPQLRAAIVDGSIPELVHWQAVQADEALLVPAVLKSRPDAVYVVLGTTHPNLVRDQGETYRDGLLARAAALGTSDHVVFLDQFVDRPTLLEYISMCDVYVTPYLNQAQMTSGTLAYSFGLGKAVVSTLIGMHWSYWPTTAVSWPRPWAPKSPGCSAMGRCIGRCEAVPTPPAVR